MSQNFYGTVQAGAGTTFGDFCDIGDTVIGSNCKIQCHVSISRGWTIGDDVFIGPGVRFANDKYPNIREPFTPMKGWVEDAVVIGMGALIGPGIRIGRAATIGMGAVVLKDVPAGETWVGNPARKLETN